MKSWIVFYDRKADKVVAFEDKHDGNTVQESDNLKELGTPRQKTEFEAINYITQVLSEEDIKSG